MESQNNNPHDENFESESGIATWSLLKAHFKRGALVWVDRSLRIEDVGQAVVNDDKIQVEYWMSEMLISPFPIALAETEPSLRCFIAQPWVFAQEVD
jgi:hypothetical protein